mmetsp:Transcript_20951/g.45807  ORF Transcript_20951/g.45807 Transcript_20951/m.45807 type:complete len:259 (-) Transcript_20951:35-811(-)
MGRSEYFDLEAGNKLECRRSSTFEKVRKRSQQRAGSYICSARIRACIFVAWFGVLLVVLMNKLLLKYERVRVYRDARFPSLNLLDYDMDSSFPVFPRVHPKGLKRVVMPQLPDRTGKEASVWALFFDNIRMNGGSVMRDMVDLRFTRPLQSELSGHIVYNILFGDGGEHVRQKVDKNPKFFSDHIILVKTPIVLKDRDGTEIPAGTLFNLDGHHTNEVLKVCAKEDHTSIRHGFFNRDNHVCGKTFDTVQNVTVIENL